MKFNGKIFAAVARIGGRTMLKCKKYSPEIMLAGGIVIGVAAVVSAVAAGRKIDEATEETHKELDDIQEQVNAEITEALNELDGKITPEQDKAIRKRYRKQFLRAYAHGGLRYLRVFLKTIILAILAVGLILGSHGVLKGRYLKTAAAYATLDEAFKGYRVRVRDKFGEDIEQNLFNGVEDVSYTKDDESGEVTTESVKKQTAKKKNSPYEFDFNKNTAPLDATTNLDHNYFYLKAQQCAANDMYHARGHLFLNEVLDLLGLPRTQEGAILGWVKDAKNGDDFVDFGFSDYYTDEYAEVQTGNMPNIHLNFNCDGVIYDKI